MKISSENFEKFLNIISVVNSCCGFLVIRDSKIQMKSSNNSGYVFVDLLKSGILTEKISIILDNPKIFIERMKMFPKDKEDIEFSVDEDGMILVENPKMSSYMYSADGNIKKYGNAFVSDENWKVYDEIFSTDKKFSFPLDGDTFKKINNFIKFCGSTSIHFNIDKKRNLSVIISADHNVFSKKNSSGEKTIIKNVYSVENEKIPESKLSVNCLLFTTPMEEIVLNSFYFIDGENDCGLIQLQGKISGIEVNIFQVGFISIWGDING